MSFIENAKKAKKEKGYTTNDLSKTSGIPLGTLSKLFSGVIEEPKLSAAVAIAKALDTTVDKLCNLEDGTYSNEELDLLAKYRKLDTYGKNLANLVIDNELIRHSDIKDEQTADAPSAPISKENAFADAFKQEKKKAKETSATITPSPAEYAIRTLPLYNTPVSAGIGEFLDSSDSTSIKVKNTPKVAQASYALRVNGDSMMPDYSDGDILIIKEQNVIGDGELGIFVCDGQGYFKKFGGDRLLSLNPTYDDILLSDFTQSSCVGLVLGRLKAKKS